MRKGKGLRDTSSDVSNDNLFCQDCVPSTGASEQCCFWYGYCIQTIGSVVF